MGAFTSANTAGNSVGIPTSPLVLTVLPAGLWVLVG